MPFWEPAAQAATRQRRPAPRKDADQQTFPNEQPNNTSARCTNRHTERDFATATTETDQQEIRDIAAGDQQHKANRCKKGGETSTNIFGHILVEAF